MFIIIIIIIKLNNDDNNDKQLTQAGKSKMTNSTDTKTK